MSHELNVVEIDKHAGSDWKLFYHSYCHPKVASRLFRCGCCAARTGVQSSKPVATEEEEEEDDFESRAQWSIERQEAERLVKELIALWAPPMETLSRAGRAFEGLEALLGGGRSGTFDLQVS